MPSDKSKSIEVKELKGALELILGRRLQLTDKDVENIMNAFDKDKNKRLELREFRDLHTYLKEFLDADQDKSGFVDEDEILSMIQKEFPNVPFTEADKVAMFKEFDKNDDKKVTAI